jgi:hypothetical protein
MAIDRVVNKGIKGGYVTGIFSAGGYIALNSSNVVVAANSAGETVQEMAISVVSWAAANGVTFNIKRGANNVLNLELNGTMDFQASGIGLETGGEAAANVVVTRAGTGPASLVIKLHKRPAITGGSSY